MYHLLRLSETAKNPFSRVKGLAQHIFLKGRVRRRKHLFQSFKRDAVFDCVCLFCDVKLPYRSGHYCWFFFIYYFYFISIFILLIRKKAIEAQTHRVSNYLDLLGLVREIKSNKLTSNSSAETLLLRSNVNPSLCRTLSGVNFLFFQVAQISSYMEPLASATIGAASTSSNHQRQMDILDFSKTVAESVLQLVYAAKEGGGNPKVSLFDKIVRVNIREVIDEWTSRRALSCDQSEIRSFTTGHLSTRWHRGSSSRKQRRYSRTS